MIPAEAKIDFIDQICQLYFSLTRLQWEQMMISILTFISLSAEGLFDKKPVNAKTAEKTTIRVVPTTMNLNAPSTSNFHTPSFTPTESQRSTPKATTICSHSITRPARSASPSITISHSRTFNPKPSQSRTPNMIEANHTASPSPAASVKKPSQSPTSSHTLISKPSISASPSATIEITSFAAATKTPEILATNSPTSWVIATTKKLNPFATVPKTRQTLNETPKPVGDDAHDDVEQLDEVVPEFRTFNPPKREKGNFGAPLPTNPEPIDNLPEETPVQIFIAKAQAAGSSYYVVSSRTLLAFAAIAVMVSLVFLRYAYVASHASWKNSVPPALLRENQEGSNIISPLVADQNSGKPAMRTY